MNQSLDLLRVVEKINIVYLNGDSRLIVRVGGEGLSLLGRDRGVALDEWCHHTSSSLNAKRQGSNVKEKKIAHFLRGVTSEDGGLNSSAIGNSFIWIDGLAKLLTVEEILEQNSTSFRWIQPTIVQLNNK